ncbi:MAG: hypothetical protein OEX82_09125 [Nitrosomonas sp.]|nr:hypothetical protein [Nitrosomonas sp.]
MRKLISWLTRFLRPPIAKDLECQDSAGVSIKLSDEDKTLFTKFCQFVWIQGEPIPLIYDIKSDVYISQGVSLQLLKHFESIGLLTIEPDGYVKKKFGKHTRLFYVGKPTKIEFPNDANNQLSLGHVLLTDAGKALAVSYGVSRNQAFYEYVIAKWFQQGLVLSSIQLGVEKSPHSH